MARITDSMSVIIFIGVHLSKDREEPSNTRLHQSFVMSKPYQELLNNASLKKSHSKCEFISCLRTIILVYGLDFSYFGRRDARSGYKRLLAGASNGVRSSLKHL